MRTHLLTTTAIAVALLAATSSARAQANNEWTGTASADWFTNANWALGQHPISTTQTFPPNNINGAVINTVNPSEINLPTAAANFVQINTGMLTIQSGGTLNQQGGALAVGSVAGGTGMVTIHGTVSSTGALIGVFGRGTVTVSGAGATLTTAGAASLGAVGGSEGTLTISNGAVVTNTGTFVGNGAGTTGTVELAQVPAIRRRRPACSAPH